MTTVLRRLTAVFVLTAGLLLVAAVNLTSSEAAPYPPSTPSSTVRSPSSEVRTSSSVSPTNETRNTADTGFDSLTASLIAGALLIGGGVLVFAGRRGRHS